MTPNLRHASHKRAVACACLVLGAALSAREQAPTFRSSVELIAVDVQVVDGNGIPVLGLGPEKFEVSINGRRRRVASAELLRFDDMLLPAGANAARAGSTSASAWTQTGTDSADGRLFIIAIDTMSFQPSATLDVRAAARAFVQQLQPNDLVGLLSFPVDRRIDVTTNHAAISRDLDRIVGRGEPQGANRYQLMPSEIVDLTTLRESASPELTRLVASICLGDRDPDYCRRNIANDAQMIAQIDENIGVQRINSMRDMLRALASSPRRKTIVMLSTGIITTDRVGGRPDIEDLGRLIGQEAGRANATIYVLHVDQHRTDVVTAASNRRPRVTDNFSRDSAILARPLNQIAAASGGALFTVAQGGGEFAFNRIARETSAYYLLGVEPDPADRDGKPRALKVKADTSQRGTTVRARSWVVVPAK